MLSYDWWRASGTKCEGSTTRFEEEQRTSKLLLFKVDTC